MNNDKKPLSKAEIEKKELLVSIPDSLTGVRSVGRPKPLPPAKTPDWNFWKHMPQVNNWDACALALNINPYSLKRHPQNWMHSESVIFLKESFTSDEQAESFNKLSRLLEANKDNKQYFTSTYPDYEVRLSEFAKWCAPIVRDLTGNDIPQELAELANDAPQTAPAATVKAVPVTTPSDDWKVKARAIADKIALRKYESGIREITARNICEAVATELAKDPTTHGNRGERSSGTVRNQALKGWKFIQPTGINGTSGTVK